ncbi:MAG TPA: hypothetical protein VIP70_04855 [Nitrososphaeraceae archaeon]
MNNSKKETKIEHNSNKNNVIIKQRKDKQQLNILLSDVIHEARQKYRESENIGIDPTYIIEEEEKRQPLSFQE